MNWVAGSEILAGVVLFAANVALLMVLRPSEGLQERLIVRFPGELEILARGSIQLQFEVRVADGILCGGMFVTLLVLFPLFPEEERRPAYGNGAAARLRRGRCGGSLGGCAERGGRDQQSSNADAS